MLAIGDNNGKLLEMQEFMKAPKSINDRFQSKRKEFDRLSGNPEAQRNI